MFIKSPKPKGLRDLTTVLPHYSYSRGAEHMEPVNLVIVGDRPSIIKHLRSHDWLLADEINAKSLYRAVVAGLLNKAYADGPMADSYLLGRHFDLAFEKPTRTNTYRRRHHIRLWRLPFRLRNQRVWAGTVSYERSTGLSDDRIPTHHIAPTLSWEEAFLADSLGVSQPHFLRLTQPQKGRLNNGDQYNYDGRALVLSFN